LSIFCLVQESQKPHTFFLAGLFASLSLLCRYSSIVSLLPPFVILFIYVFVYNWRNQQESTSFLIKRLGLFLFGGLIPMVLLFTFLLSDNLIDDFFLQNQAIADSSGFKILEHPFMAFTYFFTNILLGRSSQGTDLRSLFFSLNFLVNLFALGYLFYKTLIKGEKLTSSRYVIITISLFALFGYLNSLHKYNIFRLMNGSSIGVGVFFYILVRTSKFINKKFRKLIWIPVIAIYIVLGNSLAFASTTSVNFPWQLKRFTGEGVQTTDISLFKGKLLTPDYYNFYHEIFKVLSQFDSSYQIINYTKDPIPLLISNLSSPQLSPIYLSDLDQAYPERAEQIEQLIKSNQAILISSEDLKLSNYRIIFNQPWPTGVPYMGKKMLYISIPKNLKSP
jgi:hypothetical protein